MRAQGGGRTWLPQELLVDGDDLVDAAGELRVALADVFGMPIFITAVRTCELLAAEDHAPRVAIGRTVLRRESWSVPAAAVPQRAEESRRSRATRGMPRRVFTKSPLERKPMYLDTASPVLGRILCRQARQAAADAPDARIAFTEMLPTPGAVVAARSRPASATSASCGSSASTSRAAQAAPAYGGGASPRARRCAARRAPSRRRA